jgi:phage baseplate assembly protein W
MAYLLGTKYTNEIKRLPIIPFGLTFPITTEFKVAYDKVSQARTNLINLIRTRPGERIMQPQFGVRLLEFLFEPNDDLLEVKIQREITDAIGYWLPYIKVESLDIDASDYLKDRNTVMVTLRYSVSGSPDIQSVTFTVGNSSNSTSTNGIVAVSIPNEQVEREYGSLNYDFFDSNIE